jgi:hypothetical protein
MNTEQPTATLPQPLLWLHDAPLFIDEAQIERFYDAVVRPLSKQGAITIQVTEANADALRSKFNMDASVTTEKLAGLMLPVLAILKPEFKASGEIETNATKTRMDGSSFQFVPIDNPQRQLEQLTIHYLFNHPNRLFLPKALDSPEWRDPAAILSVPRALAFLDLPGYEESLILNASPTQIIPTAAEFSNGKIVQIYRSLRFVENEALPEYPDTRQPPSALGQARREYWKWFDKHYSATKSMIAVEEAASENGGRINWIDFRLPISSAGDTLHLHVCPSGKFDTGTFAYNFIKRGYKHGLRLVGTLKSDPDMNVLAIYDK